MPMNIHAPSLGIGATIAAIFILGAFFVLDFDMPEKDNPSAEINISDNPEQAKKSDSKIELSLFSAKATTLLGSPDATVTLVEFGDYQCFYCNRFFHNTESGIVKNYVDTGKVKMIFKDFTIIAKILLMRLMLLTVQTRKENSGSTMMLYKIIGQVKIMAGRLLRISLNLLNK